MGARHHMTNLIQIVLAEYRTPLVARKERIQVHFKVLIQAYPRLQENHGKPMSQEPIVLARQDVCSPLNGQRNRLGFNPPSWSTGHMAPGENTNV